MEEIVKAKVESKWAINEEDIIELWDEKYVPVTSIGLGGQTNIKNTCYFISLFNALMSCPAFVHYFSMLPSFAELLPKKNTFTIIGYIQKVCKTVAEGKEIPQNTVSTLVDHLVKTFPNDTFIQIHLMPGVQTDPEECYRFLSNHMEAELFTTGIPSVFELFNMLAIEHRIGHPDPEDNNDKKHTTVVKLRPRSVIELPCQDEISVTGDDLSPLLHFTKNLDVKYRCKCGETHTSYTKKEDFTPREILIFHFQTYKQINIKPAIQIINRDTGHILTSEDDQSKAEKVKTILGDIIKIENKYKLLEHMNCTINGKKRTYSAVAIIDHMGTIGGGHYTALCKRRCNGIIDWVRLNDTRTSIESYKMTKNTYIAVYVCTKVE